METQVKSNHPLLQSLKTRATVFTLAIFVLGIWTLSFFVSRSLQTDMEHLLGEQQFSVVTSVAKRVNDDLGERLQALQTIAERDVALLANPTALQAHLEQQSLLQSLFNGGVFIAGPDGTVIVDVPLSAQRIGVNYLDRDFIASALKEGVAMVGRPFVGKKLQAPIFGIAVPMRDAQGKILGVLVGVTNLGKSNFLDQITNSPYGKSGGYVLISAQHRLVVTATDKSRIIEQLPPQGVNIWVDRFAQGYEGWAVAPNPKGVNVLVSGKGIPIAGWYVLASLPSAEAFAPIEQMKQRMLLATLLLTILIGTLTWWVLRKQLAPLVATADAMTALANSTEMPQPLPNTQQDEIGKLVMGFNRILQTWGQHKAALQRSKDMLERTESMARLASFEWEVDTNTTTWSPEMFRIFGLNPALGAPNLQGQAQLYTPESTQILFDAVNKAIADGTPYDLELTLLHTANGLQRTCWVKGFPQCDANGRVVRLAGLLQDITERKAYQSQLEYIAHFDLLTNLPNRTLLSDRLQQAMVQAQRTQQQLVVAYLDLDCFKTINDHHGHQTGDRVLITLAQRMKSVLREGDTMARIGGDEFVAVLINLETPSASVPLLQRLLLAAAEPVQVDQLTLQVSASLGATFYPQAQDVEPDQLLRQADQAMYHAKVAGKNRYHIFDAAQDSSQRNHHEALQCIQQALDRHEFVLYYQPKVNMSSGLVIGAEALIRWQHPEKGLLPPSAFLPVIENHPLAVDVGEWVINAALHQMHIWHDAGLNFPVSVNIGARQLEQINFVERLKIILAQHPQVNPAHLELEVLETSALADMVQVSQVIEDCAQMGVHFALDDFGTGYSSLTYLKHLRVAQLKIDQSFVRDMLDDPDDLAILKGIVGLAAAFKRQVIAEGVETVAHGTALLQLGCELAQGYGIARPMPPEQLPIWAANWRPDVAWCKLNKSA